MVRGFYQLGSGIMSQSSVLDTISNNIANAETTGYKKQTTVLSAFGQMMMQRVGGTGTTNIGSSSFATVVDETATIHTQGTLTSTGRDLDFAIAGDGFFAVDNNGTTEYTRKGDFELDAGGYLVNSNGYRVLNTAGNPIYIGSGDFTCDENGGIQVNGTFAGRIGVYTFDDYNTLQEAGDGLYTGDGAYLSADASIKWQTLESSNVDMADEMTNAISAQRQLQACSQALQMYDDVLSDAASQLGKV